MTAPFSDRLLEVVQKFMELEPSVKRRTHIALEHLHQALSQTAPSRRALEISVALESLLSRGRGSGFSIALRAALLVSDSVDERMETRALIEAVYKMRNNLVHKGVAETEVKVKGQGKKSAGEVVGNAAKITALVVRRIIMEGRFPEWNRFELSNGST